MTESIMIALMALGGVLLTAAGALGGSWLARRSSREATKLQAQVAQRTAEHTLIDQLQEELKGFRESAERRATAQDERMNRLEHYMDEYRTYAHDLRAWIFDEKPPPPPAWPEGLPK